MTSTRAIDQVEELLGGFVRSEAAPGLAYAVIREAQVVWTGGFGVLDVRSGRRPGGDSRFRIASMTKSFVAGAVLVLRDRGRLSLDAPVAGLVPELAGLPAATRDSAPLTVRDLLTMSGGMPTDDAWADRLEAMTPDEFNALLRSGFRFVHAPRSNFEYSNLGYALLGRVITNVSGTSFRDVVRTELLTPLGLDDTSFDSDGFDAAQLATGHRRGPDGWEPVPPSGSGEFSAIGGLISTVADISRWVLHQLDAFPPRDDPDLGALCRASRREMQQMHQLDTVVADLEAGQIAATAHGYGFGLFVERGTLLGDIVHHSGGYPGFGSHMRWHRDSGVGIVVLANATYAPVSRLSARALDLLVRDSRRTFSIRHVNLADRSSAEWPETTAARAAVDELIDHFDDATADELFGANVDLDMPRPERRAFFARADADCGRLSPSRPPTARTPAESRWRRPGTDADLVVSLSMTPEAAPRLQRVDVRVVRRIPEPVRAVAQRLATALESGQMPDEFEEIALTARIASALGGPFVVDDAAEPSADPAAAALTLHGRTADWLLTVTLDDATVARLGLRMVPFSTRLLRDQADDVVRPEPGGEALP